MDQKTPHAIGVYLAVVQLLFTVTWTVYVIFLPQLAAQAGLPKTAVPYILLADQLIFVFMDFGMGVAADRVSNVLGRLGHVVLTATLVSCLAFMLLPVIAPQGMPWLLILLTAVWTISSSALRAPPLMLLGKYAAKPQVPWLSSLSLFGLGVAGAIAPYLTVTLRDMDPRLPFALSSVALALATMGIMWAERALARNATATGGKPVFRGLSPLSMTFFLGILLAAVGFQIHSALNSGPLYAKFAKPDHIQFLAPTFWIGFNVLILPASQATKRFGGVAVAGGGAILAGLGALFAQQATSLPMLIAMQLIAGGGWGCVLMSAVSAALALGHSGREGQITGGVFALLAVATVTRMAVVTAELNKDKDLTAFFAWAPAGAWIVAGIVLLTLSMNKSIPRDLEPVPVKKVRIPGQRSKLTDLAKPPSRFDAD